MGARLLSGEIKGQAPVWTGLAPLITKYSLVEFGLTPHAAQKASSLLVSYYETSRCTTVRFAAAYTIDLRVK